MAKSFDIKDFYQIPADNRDLNYGNFFESGDVKTSFLEDYNSHNTTRLNVEQTMQKLLKLDYIQQEIALWNQR